MPARAITIVTGLLMMMLFATPVHAAPRDTGKAPAAAIFDFGMKSGGDQWAWLEKGLADMFTTHFVRRGIPVVARDDMETLAMKIRWVPELAENKKELDEVKSQLKVSYLVTGVYAVNGDKITITAQIVSMETRKEVFRREISGRSQDVLELQAKLAGQVVPFFGGQVPGQTLPELTPWTKSIPAAKALYQGVHLYDQGRYGEAWLYFRRAAATDPEYHDAAYWVARMYYYMDQFEHARLAYEKFIYADTSHPRAGDAVQEYLHTFESLRPAPELLLKLYESLSAAYPRLTIDLGKFAQPVPMERWLQLREAQLRGQLGQHKLATELAAGRRPGQSMAAEMTVAGRNATLHNLLTGEVLLPPILANQYGAANHVAFTPERTEITINTNAGGSALDYFLLSAPSGYVFKSVHAFLLANDSRTRIGMHIHKDVVGDVPTPSQSRAFSRARDEGFLFENLPRAGFFRCQYWLHTPEDGKDKTTNVRGMRFVVQLEKLGPHGALDVTCDTTGDFRVDVDGRMGRWGSGIVGLLPVGEHTLRFYSAGKIVVGSKKYARSAFGEWTTRVTVKEGHVTKVVGLLPWADNSPWTGWNSGKMVGTSYPGYYLGTHAGSSMPSLQMDHESIRMVWSYMGDLWWAESRDGEHYSAPAKFPLPISTAAEEMYPHILRDESGRFVLVFVSDRNALHERRVYLSWSRDFKHWSAPTMIFDRPIDFYDITQDQLGRFLLVDSCAKRVTISESRDIYRWSTLSTLDANIAAGAVRLVPTPDGRLDLFVAMLTPAKEQSEWENTVVDNVGVYHSIDGEKWTPREELVQLKSNRELSISVLQPQGRQILAYFDEANRVEPLQVQFQERIDRSYAPATAGMGGIGSRDATLAYHPKWGYVMAWSTSRRFGWGGTLEGPFAMRGPSLDPVIAKLGTPQPETAPANK